MKEDLKKGVGRGEIEVNREIDESLVSPFVGCTVSEKIRQSNGVFGEKVFELILK